MVLSMMKWFATDEGKNKCADDYGRLMRVLLEPLGMEFIKFLSNRPYDRKSSKFLEHLKHAKEEGKEYNLPAKHQKPAIALIEHFTGEVGSNSTNDQKKDFLQPLMTIVGRKFLEGFISAIRYKKTFLPQLFLTILESLNAWGVIKPEHRAPPNPKNRMQAIVKVFAKTPLAAVLFFHLFFFAATSGSNWHHESNYFWQ